MDKVKGYFLSWLKRFLIFIVLPFFLAFKSFQNLKKRSFLRAGLTSFFSLFFLPFWLLMYLVTAFVPVVAFGMYEDTIKIAGTGSMYPTIPKGEGENQKILGKQTVAEIRMKPYPTLGYEIGRGDLVSAENEKIKKSIKKTYGVEGGIIKRVIAVSGDRILLKDGLVYINGTPVDEPYIAGPTTGADFLKDNKEITVPKNKLFIMGDNRKRSYDSRHYGFISYEDVDHVLSYSNQSEKISLASSN